MAARKLVFSVLQHKSWELRSETSPPQTVVTHPADSRRGTTGHWACFCRLPCQKAKRSRDPFVMIARSLERMMISCRIRVYHPYRYFNPPRASGMHLNLYPVDPADTDWGPSWWYPSENPRWDSHWILFSHIHSNFSVLSSDVVKSMSISHIN